MSSKFQPGEETFDDVSGHRLSHNVVDDEETEGHRLSHNVVDDEETEGHRINYNTALPPDDDDEGVEGHRRTVG